MSNLTPLQISILEILKFFHSFCTKHGLRYYVIGGTALGAVRHHGFIPWDDDADVGMPRKDYEEFARLWGDKPVSHYMLETDQSPDPAFCYPFAKLYDTHTTLVENVRHPIKRGVYLDIFPIDGIGNTMEEAYRNYRAIDRLMKLRALRVVNPQTARAWYKNCLLKTVQALPSSLIGERKISDKIVTLCKRMPYDDCEIVGNLVGAWGAKEIVPKHCYGTPLPVPFEDCTVFVPENYDEFLTLMYGDWRQLPPEEKRITHHGFTFDLDHSYLE